MRTPGDKLPPPEWDTSEISPGLHELHQFALDHIQGGHAGVWSYRDLASRSFVAVCDECGERYELRDFDSQRARWLVEDHVQYRIEHGPTPRRSFRAVAAQAWSSVAPRLALAGDLLLAVLAVWFGLDAYLSGLYELAVAWFFAVVYAAAGLTMKATI